MKHGTRFPGAKRPTAPYSATKSAIFRLPDQTETTVVWQVVEEEDLPNRFTGVGWWNTGRWDWARIWREGVEDFEEGR